MTPSPDTQDAPWRDECGRFIDANRFSPLTHRLSSRSQCCGDIHVPLLTLIRRARTEAEECASSDTENQATPATEQLVIALYPRILIYVYHRVARFADACEIAEDVAQDVIVRLIQAIRACRATSECAVNAWIMTTVRRCLGNQFAPPHGVLYQRKLTLQNQPFSIPDVDPRLRAEWFRRASAAPACERLLQIAYECSLRLDHVTAAVLWHRLVAGDEWPAVARACRLTSTAAKRRYQRAQRQLRQAVIDGIDQLALAERDELLRWLDQHR